MLTGEPDDWQRHWRVLAEIRADHDLVVDASVRGRAAAADRFARPCRRTANPGEGAPGSISAGAEPVRIVLPGADVRPTVARDVLDRP